MCIRDSYRTLRSNGKLPASTAPRVWFRGLQYKRQYIFAHDCNNAFRSPISFTEDCLGYLIDHPGPPGIFSDATDIMTRITTLEACEFFGPPPVPFLLDRHEDWLATIAIRLAENAVNPDFDQWRVS